MKHSNIKIFSAKNLGGYALRRIWDENFTLGDVFYGNTVDMFGAFGHINKRGVKLFAIDNADGDRSGRDVQKLHKS